ncbi:MAG: N-acetylmuramidase [Desulfobulbaceae bacterium]|nr:N-acetylmuramidase [Desulfobulbaceae bacterium]
MAEFEKAFKALIGVEGGYVNDPADPGGETKYGISKRSYPSLNIAALTITQAMGIYKRDFWDKARLDEIVDQAIAEEVFDSMVNIGPKVMRWLQRAYNLTNWNDGNRDLVVDGVIGSGTIAAINQASRPERILKTLNGLQFGHYVECVENNPKLEKWFGGWLTRVWER